MDAFRALLACPACRGALSAGWRCDDCGACYGAADGIPALRLAGDARTETVRDFYQAAPFPGYPPNDSLGWLRARAERSPFARMLDQAVPGDARIIEVGCGTGQMSLYLARADRLVVGADLSRNALMLATAAARRCGIEQVRFVESDIANLGARPGAFDVVYCSGVLHHTPDPARSFQSIAALARPGGMFVIGLYNSLARIPLRLRRGLARLIGDRGTSGDPVLRDRAHQPARREAWLRDQYHHPEEHRHTLAEVQRWFDASGIDYVRAYPSALLDGEERGLFEPDHDKWRLEGWLAQIGWIRKLGHEGGLFVVVGRRRDTV